MIHYMVEYIGTGVLGFLALVAISAPQVWWRDRHARRERAAWNRDA